MTGDLFLCTTITRTDRDSDPIELDVLIYFEVVSYSPGCPARIRWDENDHPAEPAEYEFEFLRAEFDGGECADAPGPLTAEEIAALKDWFTKHHQEACEAADEQRADDDGPDPDEARERQWEERRLERAFGSDEL